MTREFQSGGEAVVAALVAQGVDTIYTLSGGHINPIYVHLESTDIRLFDTRHEQAAVWMADAHARFTRGTGVALVTAGPGFTNALTAVAGAAMAGTPLVLIAGSVGVSMVERLDLQDMRQAPVAEPMVKKALVCHSVDRIPHFVDQAFREARSGRPGPVYLELPVDVLAATPSKALDVPTTYRTARPVDLARVEQVADLLMESKKPMLIAGSGAWYSDAGTELRELIELTGVPLFTAANGRGVVSDTHPMCFGGSLAIRPGAGLAASIAADLIIILGNRINLFSLFGDIYNPDATIVQVDIEAEEIGRNREIEVPVVSDVKAFVSSLHHAIDERGGHNELVAGFEPWIEELREAERSSLADAEAQWSSDAVPVHPMRLAREVDDFLDRDDDILVTDGGDATTWIGMTRTIRSAGHYLDYGLFGSLGGGVPNANAAKFLYPEKRVVLFTGDGSLGFNFMEFERAVSKELPIVVVVSNDLGWGMIRHSQEVRLGHSIEGVVDIGTIHYEKLVEALGGVGILVTEPSEIRPALEAAFASGKTALINVMTDPTAVSPGSLALANVGAYE